MSKKLSLAGALDGNALGTPSTPPEPAPSTPAEAQRPPVRAVPVPDQPAGEGPRYLALVRKEARITDEQAEQLANLTRQLNKARKGQGERITDNTLIRVAIDVLLSRQDELNGSTEPQLRKSLSLPN